MDKQNEHLAKKLMEMKDDVKHDNEGLSFVYPYGSTLNVQKPAFPLLSSGAISYPMNRPLCATYVHTKSKTAKLLVVGSVKLFDDEFLEKEDNSKLVVQLVLHGRTCSSSGCSRTRSSSPTTSRRRATSASTNMCPTSAPSLSTCDLVSRHVPLLTFQETEELPRDFTTLFDDSLFKFDTDLIPEAVNLHKELALKHETISLITPSFETPLPPLQAATFPPSMKELPPPNLDLFDLDEQFSSDKYSEDSH